jgi:nucleoside-diphosphate-sugar epimerase
MRVLVTGAGGNLGRAVIPALVEAGHEPRLMDFRPLPGEHRVVVGDVRDPSALARAMDGVDAVVHGAAIHGVHLDRWRPTDFWDINATGTFGVYHAARAAGVSRVVFSSSMVVYGQSSAPPPDAWALVSEDSPTLPDNVYGLSKVAGEETARFHARASGISTVSLRLGMFVPESFERYGFRLLFGGVDDRDVAHATLLALEHAPPDGFDAFNIMAPTPFSADDLVALHDDPLAVVERHYPGTREVVERRGLDVRELIWGRTVWSVERATAILGFRPQYDFGRFVVALEAGDHSLYPFAGLPWWGVDPPSS